MMLTTALLDANILYSAPLRDIFMELALNELFRVRWTDRIQEEWINALLRDRPTLNRERYERTRDMMNQAIMEANITNYESLIPNISLPDLDDRHVLASAIVGGCDVIITHNLSDFPQSVVQGYGLDVQSPDDFLLPYLLNQPELFCGSLQTIRTRLKNPPYTTHMYIEVLKKAGLTKTVLALTNCADWI
ncbi:MAG UNVERIFIED_CONTAM: PIN domain-containing protein [Anaerolineae bacterium]|jgi:hypothetical protein